MVLGISNENQDQPSPISVLEPPFEDDNAAQESFDCMKAGHLGNNLWPLSLSTLGSSYLIPIVNIILI